MEIRHSRQRDAVYAYVKHQKTHPTAEAVYAEVRKEYPNISLGTVYRNLMLLKDLGMLQTVDVGDGVIHFDADTSEHSHFRCTRCGAVLDLDGGDIDEIKKIAARHFGGSITGYSCCFRGLCPACAGRSPERDARTA